MTPDDAVKLFRLSHEQIESDLTGLERSLAIDLGRDPGSDSDRDNVYYPQFGAAIRSEATAMARHYEIFYCLERSFRQLVRERMDSQHGAGWWATNVTQSIRDEVAKRRKEEFEGGVTPRSSEDIDYTTFGELGQIVRENWDDFGDTLNNERAFGILMKRLQLLRGPIAHCTPLAPDEVERLGLTLRDWFRLTE